jgi:hypothetical protein
MRKLPPTFRQFGDDYPDGHRAREALAAPAHQTRSLGCGHGRAALAVPRGRRR